MSVLVDIFRYCMWYVTISMYLFLDCQKSVDIEM